MTKRVVALVLVHGQGEQRPMQMGPEFVEHVLGGNFDAGTFSPDASPQIRWKPEDHEGLNDVRRIEVRYGDEDDRPDIDLFEFYWAPNMAGNGLFHFQNWFFGLLRRPLRELPKRVRWLKPFVIAWVWAIFLTMLFYLYLTAGALFPVQLVQVATHGPGDFLQFALDIRLAVFCVPFILTVAVFISLIRRRYGWALSLCLSAAILCAGAPLFSNAREEIADDTYRLAGDVDANPSILPLGEDPPYNIWGAPLEDGSAHPSGLLIFAASLSRSLCGEKLIVRTNEKAQSDEETAPSDKTPSELKKALRDVNVFSPDPLQWANLNSTSGGELNDICLAPIALASPVVFARDADSGHVLATIILAIMGAVSYLVWRIRIRGFLVDIMGDSARYLNSHPDNILARHDIRKAGIHLLTRLHETERYDKIMVLAHSLGSVVAYDVLRQYWGRVSGGELALSGALRAALLSAGDATEDNPANGLSAWQKAQGDAFDAVQAKWKVSDFITMGSPLAHGRLLLEGSPEHYHSSARFTSQRDVTRSIPACPPVALGAASGTLDPSDMFSVIRWTNLYFTDDLVGGTCAMDSDGKLFGPGVRDVGFESKRITARGLSHNSYWLSRLPVAESGTVPWLKLLQELVSR